MHGFTTLRSLTGNNSKNIGQFLEVIEQKQEEK